SLKSGYRKALLSGYGFPVMVSLLLHGLLLLVLSASWSEERKLDIVPPRNIKASLVEVVQPVPQSSKPKPQIDHSVRKAKEAAERKRQETLRQQKAEEQRQREVALRKEQDAKEKARKEAEARKREEQLREQERQELERRREEDRLQKQKEETLRRLEQERIQRELQERAAQQAMKQAEQDSVEVSYYSALLNDLIVNSWNRPPSARNNMTALLQVTLSPFGDLLEVKLLNGSGNDSFDRSAVQAVQRAAPFPELQKLERRIFDAHFKRFNFRFRPEDLVR
ncbi:hypothetical protein ACH42_01080, partial [Endozoicomonas sp. (ex Bugula neritina AB1)]